MDRKRSGKQPRLNRRASSRAGPASGRKKRSGTKQRTLNTHSHQQVQIAPVLAVSSPPLPSDAAELKEPAVIAESPSSAAPIAAAGPVAPVAAAPVPALAFSDEQRAIAQAVAAGRNVAVDAVAGSGKSTTVALVCQSLPPGQRVIVLTYNKQLCDESRDKIRRHGGNRPLDVRTIHSCAQWLYGQPCHVDNGLDHILQHQLPLLEARDVEMRQSTLRLLVVDELQDLRPMFYQIISKILRDLGTLETRLLILGDTRQAIYRFNGACTKYLEDPHRWFGDVVTGEWQTNLKLSRTFRCTQPMVDMINRGMLGYERMTSAKASAEQVDYIVADLYRGELHKHIRSLIRRLVGYKYDQVSIMARTIRSKSGMTSPVQALANGLSALGIPICRVEDDGEGRSEKDLAGKVLVSTIHAMKGCERRLVFVVGFDDSYYTYRDSGGPAPPEQACPDELYVATTRATEKLVLLHHYRCNRLPFLRKEAFAQTVNALRMRKIDPRQRLPPPPLRSFSVSQLLTFMPFALTRDILSRVDQHVVTQANTVLDLPTLVPQEFGRHEQVSSLHGLLIPALRESQLRPPGQPATMLASVINMMARESYGSLPAYKLAPYIAHCRMLLAQQTADGSGPTLHTMPLRDLGLLTNLYQTVSDGYLHRLLQLTDYGWLDAHEATIRQAVDRLDFLDAQTTFEVPVGWEHKWEHSNMEVQVHGSIDAMSSVSGPGTAGPRSLWEFKCTQRLSDSHIIQAVVYVSMMYLQTGEVVDVRLFNILTGEDVRLTVRDISRNANYIVQALVDHKIMQQHQSASNDAGEESRVVDEEGSSVS